MRFSTLGSEELAALVRCGRDVYFERKWSWDPHAAAEFRRAVQDRCGEIPPFGFHLYSGERFREKHERASDSLRSGMGEALAKRFLDDTLEDIKLGAGSVSGWMVAAGAAQLGLSFCALVGSKQSISHRGMLGVLLSDEEQWFDMFIVLAILSTVITIPFTIGESVVSSIERPQLIRLGTTSKAMTISPRIGIWPMASSDAIPRRFLPNQFVEAVHAVLGLPEPEPGYFGRCKLEYPDALRELMRREMNLRERLAFWWKGIRSRSRKHSSVAAGSAAQLDWNRLRTLDVPRPGLDPSSMRDHWDVALDRLLRVSSAMGQFLILESDVSLRAPELLERARAKARDRTHLILVLEFWIERGAPLRDSFLAAHPGLRGCKEIQDTASQIPSGPTPGGVGAESVNDSRSLSQREFDLMLYIERHGRVPPGALGAE